MVREMYDKVPQLMMQVKRVDEDSRLLMRRFDNVCDGVLDELRSECGGEALKGLQTEMDGRFAFVKNMTCWRCCGRN